MPARFATCHPRNLTKPLSTYHATIYSARAEAFSQDRKHDIGRVFLSVGARMRRLRGSRFECSPVMLKTPALLCHGKTYKVI
jgi:hypothetical protein